MNKKILFIMPYFIKDDFGGGAEVQAYLTAKNLSKFFDVYYITSNPLNKEKFEIIENIKVFRILKNTSIYAIFDFPKVIYYLFKIKPHFIYLRMNYPFLLPVGIFSKFINSRTLWFSTEDITIDYFFHIKSFFKYLKGYKKFYKVPFLFLNYLLYDICFCLGIYLMDKRIVQNKLQQKKLKEKFKLESDIIYSIIEIENEVFEKPREPLIIWVSHLSERKRPELFIEIAKKLPEYKFIMIGSDSPNYPKERILNNKPNNLEYLGKLTIDETNNYFRKAWILVNTSFKEREGFPNTFLQAFKYRAVVVSISVDPDDILKNYKIGFLVGDLENAIKVIKEIIENEKLREEITQRAYNYLINNHSVNNVLAIFGIF
ncbi:MAG: glycosyltransferase family 4 protein [candidate division WOR-3 bacterium]